MSDWNFTQPEAWTVDALCTQANPDDFYPREDAAGAGFSGGAAKKVCARCDVRLQCLDYAMRTEEVTNRRARYGIWGGLTPQQRHDLAEGKTKTAVNA